MNKAKREDNKLLKINKPKALERDHYRCVLCGSSVGIAVHHIVFRSQLGKQLGQFSLLMRVLSCTNSTWS